MAAPMEASHVRVVWRLVCRDDLSSCRLSYRFIAFLATMGIVDEVRLLDSVTIGQAWSYTHKFRRLASHIIVHVRVLSRLIDHLPY